VLARFCKESWLVLVSSLVFGLLVSWVYGQLQGPIEQNAKNKLNREMGLLLGEGSTFEPVTDNDGQVLYYKGIKDGQVKGYAFKAVGGGFADKIELLLAVDAECKTLLGMAVLKTNETPGFGDKMKDDLFKGQFNGCPAPDKQNKLAVLKTGDRSKVDREIVAITGATITSEAVTKIVNDAVIAMRERIK
jgi:Na+-translocating ferredoxin:NAD+ oxidoreductase subunit G